MNNNMSWAAKITTELQDRFLQLHEEIIDFYDYMKPRDLELKEFAAIEEHMRRLVGDVVDEGEVSLYGSLATGLWVPSSDMDLSITAPGQVPLRTLALLAQRIRMSEKSWELYQIFSAQIPLLKVTDTLTGIHIDISCNSRRGVNFIQKYLERYPEAKYVICVVKYFLKQRGLNETYTGGIGSFLLFCLVISLLQHHPAYTAGIKKYTLSHFLVQFFRVYGQSFPYEKVEIDILGTGKYVPKKSPDHRLSVRCPFGTEKDLGLPVFQLSRVQQSFTYAYQRLCCQCEPLSTPLHSIIRTDDIILKRANK